MAFHANAPDKGRKSVWDQESIDSAFSLAKLKALSIDSWSFERAPKKRFYLVRPAAEIVLEKEI